MGAILGAGYGTFCSKRLSQIVSPAISFGVISGSMTLVSEIARHQAIAEFESKRSCISSDSMIAR